MPSLKDTIKVKLQHRLNTKGIPNFLSTFDRNTAHQAAVWSDKTYHVDPSSHVFTTIQEHFGNRLIASLKLPPHAVVVDIGSFIGEKLWQLKDKKDYLGIGVDIALPSLIAAKKIDIYGHKFIAADLENLPFKNQSVDLVMVFDVIEHLTHAQKGFSEIARVLRPGGQFLLHIPIKDNIFSMFWFKQKLFPQASAKDYADVGHTPDRMLTRTQIKDYLAQNGLVPEREIPYNAFFVHFWDREFLTLSGMILSKLFHQGLTKKNTSRLLHTGKIGQIRRFYGNLVVPVLEILSFPDLFLSSFNIGNTYFLLAKKT